MTEGLKLDQQKVRMDLLPPVALEEIGRVLTYGAAKYAPGNWRHVKGWRWRYAAALLRHLTRWMRGERVDAESGCPHLAHAGCCLMFLLELEESGVAEGEST